MKSLETSEMEGPLTICFIAFAAITSTSAFSPKELRTGALLIPEKIIGGVIDIVQSHKNKPLQGALQVQGGLQGGQQSFQQNYQQSFQQYPQYQQWNGQSNQQGFQYQNQNQQQNQQQNPGFHYQNGFNQGSLQGGYNNQAFPTQTTPVQGQNYNQGPNQGQYQNANQNQFGQTNQFSQANQFGQTNQLQNHQSGQYGQSQSSNNQQSGQYGQSQSSNNQQSGQYGQSQSSNNQYQGNFQGQSGQAGHTEGSGQLSQGVLVPGNQNGNGQGPTCVCQAWTKPQADIQSDTPEKTQKSEPAKELLQPQCHTQNFVKSAVWHCGCNGITLGTECEKCGFDSNNFLS